MSEDNAVDQTGASSEGDLVGRDKYTIYNYRKTKLEALLDALRLERPSLDGAQVPNEDLQYYSTPISDDGIVGLEAKLKEAGRSHQLPKAIREKERFGKIVETWAHSEVAQTILGDLLAQAEQRFNMSIYNIRELLSEAEFDELVYKEIIFPLNEKVGENPLGVSELTIAGMVYWLAEKCHIKWH